MKRTFFQPFEYPGVPIAEVEIITAHLIGKPREYLIAHPENQLDSRQQKILKQMLIRRSNGEPLAYILGEKEFFGLLFDLDKHVLIPRPETELLVEKSLSIIHTPSFNAQPAMFVDVGTGSGCVAISVADRTRKDKNLNIFALDQSLKALRKAKKNAGRHQLNKRIKFIQSDLLRIFFENNRMLKFVRESKQLIIAANLPYLSSSLYRSAPMGVRNYEPKSALLSGVDGLNHYRRLIKNIFQLKQLITTDKIHLLLEISPEQKIKLQSLLKETFNTKKISFLKDLSGRWRVAYCRIK